jgi:hypothetical protein
MSTMPRWRGSLLSRSGSCEETAASRRALQEKLVSFPVCVCLVFQGSEEIDAGDGGQKRGRVVDVIAIVSDPNNHDADLSLCAAEFLFVPLSSVFLCTVLSLISYVTARLFRSIG